MLVVDEHAVRAALLELRWPDGQPLLAADEIAQLVVEEGWIGVVLGKDAPDLGALREQVYAHLTARFPDATVEVRTGKGVYRGGAGWGRGKHVIVVLGGKGGVGKSTISVNLALTLAAMGRSVGILDADLNGPDIPHMLGVHPTDGHRGMRWKLMSRELTPRSFRRKPIVRYELELMSVGFVVPERSPLAVTGRALVSSLLNYLLFEVGWQADVLILDAPPGTGEELHVMTQELPVSGALFVTTPQDLAQMDAERTVALLRERQVPVIGLIQNMASLTCPHCQGEIDMFAHSTRLADDGVPVLARIPFDVRLSAGADRGKPLVLGDPTGPIALEFARVAFHIRRWLAERDRP
jgi:ATP-binding protein involved in chromosome partitioning